MNQFLMSALFLSMFLCRPSHGMKPSSRTVTMTLPLAEKKNNDDELALVKKECSEKLRESSALIDALQTKLFIQSTENARLSGQLKAKSMRVEGLEKLLTEEQRQSEAALSLEKKDYCYHLINYLALAVSGSVFATLWFTAQHPSYH